jgi:uncharacterized protein (DUF983 family)
MSRHSCPKCEHEVPKMQRYVRNYLWAKWECSHCGTRLGFAAMPRLLLVLVDTIIISLVLLIRHRWGLDLRWWLWGYLILSTLLVVPLIDRIGVVERRTA